MWLYYKATIRVAIIKCNRKFFFKKKKRAKWQHPQHFAVLNFQRQEVFKQPKKLLQSIPKESYPVYQKNQTVSDYQSFPCGFMALLSLTLSLFSGIS